MPPGPAAIGARPYMGFDQVAEQEIMDEIRKRFKRPQKRLNCLRYANALPYPLQARVVIF